MTNGQNKTAAPGRFTTWAGGIKTAGDVIKALGIIFGLLYGIISFWPPARVFVDQLKSRDAFAYLGYLHGPNFTTFEDVQFDNKAWNGHHIASMTNLFHAGEDVTQFVGGKSISLRSQAGSDADGPSRLADGQCVVVRDLTFRPFVPNHKAFADLKATTDGSFPPSANWDAAAQDIQAKATRLCATTMGECRIAVWATVRPVSCR